MGIIHKLWAYRQKYAILAVVLLIICIYPEVTHAAEFDEAMAKVASTIVKYLSMFVWLILAFIGQLMNNQYIMGGKMEGVLYELWLVIRNIVNIGFVFALLVAALLMVVKPSGEGGVDIKKKLPQFLLAMILVNFSWMGCRVVLDAAQVMTTVVFALPQNVNQEFIKCNPKLPGISEPIGSCLVAKSFKINPDSADVSKNNTKSGNGLQTTKNAEGNYVITWPNNIFQLELAKMGSANFFNQNSAVMIMAMNLASIQNLPLVAEKVDDGGKLTINIIFSLVMSVIIIIPIIVLFLVLLGRLVTLWVTIALMPIVFLAWVIKGSFTGSIFEGVPDVFQQFIDAAFIPVYMGVPLSLGFIMVNVASNFSYTAMVGDTAGLVDMEFNGALAGIDEIQLILWHLATIYVFWLSVKIATEKGPEMTKDIVQVVADKSKSMGQWMAMAPIKYTPFIPIQTGADGESPGYSLGTLFQLPEMLKNNLRNNQYEKTRKLMDSMNLSSKSDIHLPPATENKLNQLKKSGEVQDSFRKNLTKYALNDKPSNLETAKKNLSHLITQTGLGRPSDFYNVEKLEKLFERLFRDGHINNNWFKTLSDGNKAKMVMGETSANPSPPPEKKADDSLNNIKPKVKIRGKEFKTKESKKEESKKEESKKEESKTKEPGNDD